MLDKVTMHIFVKYEHIDFHDLHTDNPIPYFDLNKLPLEIPTVGSVYKTIENGVLVKKLEDEKTKYESLPSSFSGMAFKFFNNGRNCNPYVEIKCSPAKLLQGHNLYGFDDLELSSSNMIALLSVAYPDLYDLLDLTTIQVPDLDITYMTFIDTIKKQMLFLDHIKSISNGQTKSRGDSYASTGYFCAKNSRLKGLKIYLKHPEMLIDAEAMEKKGFKESANIIRREALTDRAKQSVRFEATIKKRFLQRKGIPTDLIGLCKYFRENPNGYKDLFNDAWSDVFKALEGQTMKATNDEDVYEKIKLVHDSVSARTGKISSINSNRVFAFYQTIKTMGYDHVKKTNSSSTFYDNVNRLIACGFSKSYIQNMHKKSNGVVIQMSQFIKVDFSNQVPENYLPPKDLDFSDYGNVCRFG
jgi:II/X family phage/plasmid replication protein